MINHKVSVMDISVDLVASFSEMSIGDSGQFVTQLPECSIF